MKKAGSIINNYFKDRNLNGEEESLNYTGIWRRITGKNIGRCTRPVAFKKGILFIEVEDSVWLYQLTLLKEKLISDFNAISGNIRVNNIIFRNTGFSLSDSYIEKNMSVCDGKKDSSIQEQKITIEELSATEIDEIKNMVFFVPDLYQDKMDRLLSSFFRLQQWKKKKGAKRCSYCCSLFFAKAIGQMEDPLCHICSREKKVKEQNSTDKPKGGNQNVFTHR